MPSQQTKTISQDRLKFVLVLTRHGVRSPTWTNARLDEYAKQPWPKWEVAPGLLSPHGKKLMTQFGSYYRSDFAARHLVEADGCADAGAIYIYADTDQRTMETGRGIADGLYPGCSVPVHSLGEGDQDELFHPAGKLGAPDAKLAYAAVSGRIGGNAAALLPAYQTQLEQMKQLLLACDGRACTAEGKKDLLAIAPVLSQSNGDHLVELKGPLQTAATFAENLQLEYLDGMPDSQVGWGRADEAFVRSLMAIHSANSDVVQRTPYLARAQASNLLAHIASTLQQAEDKHAVSGAIGIPADNAVFLVGHDTNIAGVAALVDAHWLVDGYQRDDAAPGGALVFELWNTGSGDEVRTYYTVQTPHQMHEAAALSLAAPPAKAVLFLPGCGRTGEGSPCSWSDFHRLISGVIDPAFVR